MANMKYFEVKEKLNLLNGLSEGITLYAVNSATPTICYEGDLEHLVLSNSLVGDLFEWVDESTKKEIRVKEEDGLVIQVVKKEIVSDILTSKFDGPNAAILEVLNRRISRYLKPEAEKEMDKDYFEVATDAGPMFVDKEYEDEYNAIMTFASKLEAIHVLSGVGSGDVLDLRMRVKVGEDFIPVPLYVKKSDINVILQYINILSCFRSDFELPNELYQMKADGASYSMKELPSSVSGDRSIPDAKTVSETISGYESRLQTRFGDPVIAEGAPFRNPYPNESYDYSRTVRADNRRIENPSESGVSIDSLSPVPGSNSPSQYYNHVYANSGTAPSRRPVVEDRGIRFIPAEEDVSVKEKVGNWFKTAGNYIKNHKGLILTTLLVAGGITFLAFNPGVLVTIGKVFFMMIERALLPIPTFLIKGWAAMTVADKWFFIGELILLFLGGKRLVKNFLKKRKERKTRGEEEVVELTNEELNARIAENNQNIIDLEGTLISLRHNYGSVIDEAEKERIRISIEKAEAQIARARLQIERDEQTLRERTAGLEEEALGGFRI